MQTYPASPKQTAFLTTLLAEREHSFEPDLSLFTTKQASDLISHLLAQPRVKSDAPVVPAGRYAVRLDGEELAFFRVDTPTKGRWEGYTFVKQQAGSDYYPVRGPRAAAVLASVAQDPRAASLRYGVELGSCGVCGRELTDAESRAAGIGPVCASRTGW